MNLLPHVSSIGPAGFRRFIVNLLPWKDLHTLRDMADYMYSLGTEIFESKKLALERGDEVVAQQIGSGKDLLSVLSKFGLQNGQNRLIPTVKENMKASDEDQLRDSELISQVSIPRISQ